MSIEFEFSKNALYYGEYATIQKAVTRELLLSVTNQPKRILDLGCGEGGVYRAIDWEVEHFLGVDFAKNMLELHPKDSHVECIYGNFNDPELYSHLSSLYSFDYIVSSSALQWADSLEKVFQCIALFDTPYALAVFTSNTFKTLHLTANISSPIRPSSEVIATAKKILCCKCYTKKYKLHFSDTLEMLRHIKKSGVSGARNILGYRQIKELMKNYPLDYLEFEVVFVRSTSFSKE